MFQNTLLVAIEGVDGAGKNTLTSAVAASLEAGGACVSRISFPRYGTLHADLIAAALHGKMGDMVESAYGMATLFALDRRAAVQPGGDLAALATATPAAAPAAAAPLDATPATAESVAAPAAAPHIILMDRWVASNAAYSAARTHEPIDQPGGIVDWVAHLEFSEFGLPVPDLTILIDVPVSLARARAAHREALDATRTRDIYERDSSLQDRTAAAYRALAAAHWYGPWLSVAADVNPQKVAQAIMATLPPTDSPPVAPPAAPRSPFS